MTALLAHKKFLAYPVFGNDNFRLLPLLQKECLVFGLFYIKRNGLLHEIGINLIYTYKKEYKVFLIYKEI
jgi:hypothetical protein